LFREPPDSILEDLKKEYVGVGGEKFVEKEEFRGEGMG
jgi:hypothetical protein